MARRGQRLALVAGLSATLLIPAAAASAEPIAPAAPKDSCAVPAGTTLAPGESATNSTPYDPATLVFGIEQAKLSHQNSENHITMQISVRNADERPTCAAYAVFLTFNRPGEEPEEEATGCQDQHYNDPETPQGSYQCTAIVNGPGEWEFTGTVNQPGVQTLLKNVSTTLDFPNAKVLTEFRGLKYVVEGSVFEVFLLQSHVVLASVWMVLAFVMAFLAVPRLRRTLSVIALHTLEVRRSFLNSLLWGSFGGTLGTGLYLLASKAAYDAPFSTNRFSPSAWGKLDLLPYAQNYFLVLYAKILLFGLMAVASTILMLEAGRRAQLSADAEGLESEEYDDMWAKGVHFDEEGHVLRDDDVALVDGASGGVAGTAVQSRRRTTGPVGVGQRTLAVCVVVLVIGAGGIGAAVTGLKYLHELVETAAAAAILNSGD
ncbi:MAG: hypothetical protein ACT4QG_06495 [Sporichthyaceae bacterium]